MYVLLYSDLSTSITWIVDRIISCGFISILQESFIFIPFYIFCRMADISSHSRISQQHHDASYDGVRVAFVVIQGRVLSYFEAGGGEGG